MTQILALVIIVGGSIGLLFALLWDIKRNWKKPRKKWSRNGKIILVGVIILSVLKGVESFIIEKHKTERDIHNKIERHLNIMEQASTLLTQSADIKNCDNRVQAGEIKTNVAAYLCKKPYVMDIFRKVGVQHENSLEAISNDFMEMATKRDKGESMPPEEFSKNLYNAIAHDESAP